MDDGPNGFAPVDDLRVDQGEYGTSSQVVTCCVDVGLDPRNEQRQHELVSDHIAIIVCYVCTYARGLGRSNLVPLVCFFSLWKP